MLREAPPARHGGRLADEQVVVAGKTNGRDVGQEGDGLLHHDQRQVVLVREEVVLGVHGFALHAALHVRVRLAHRREVKLAYADPDL